MADIDAARAAAVVDHYQKTAELIQVGADTLLQWASKGFLFVVDVLIVVPTLWLFLRFAVLDTMSEADARTRLAEIGS